MGAKSKDKICPPRKAFFPEVLPLLDVLKLIQNHQQGEVNKVRFFGVPSCAMLLTSSPYSSNVVAECRRLAIAEEQQTG